MVREKGTSAPGTGALRVLGDRRRPERLRLTGELDFATADVLRAAARTLGHRRHDLVVDASELSFVDCAGLGALVELACTVRRERRAFTITSPSASLTRLSALAGTDEVLGMPAGRR
jgi:anti-anti-sigma factor